MKFYDRVATTVATKIKKGASGKQILLEKLYFTASTTGTVAVTDGVKTYTFDVVAGINNEFCHNIAFEPDADVTITPTGPSVSIFADYTFK